MDRVPFDSEDATVFFERVAQSAAVLNVQRLLRRLSTVADVQIIKLNHYDFNDFLFGRLAERARRIEKRAYHFFERRGHAHGQDLDDWLQAEAEMNSLSTCEIDVSEKACLITISAPGFAAQELRVTTVPGLAVVEGESVRQSMSESEEAGEKEQMAHTIFHQIPLPEAANIEDATASFDGKDLLITVPLKATQLLLRPSVAVAKGASN